MDQQSNLTLPDSKEGIYSGDKRSVISPNRSYFVFEQPSNIVVFLAQAMLTLEWISNKVHA